jgi:1,2-diacylglycerol 3-alpha-glucosyltransferase
MHVVIFFINIGFYHAARLKAASEECQKLNWRLTAVQLTSNTLEHPWGEITQRLNFNLKTLMTAESLKDDLTGLPQLPNKVLNELLQELNPGVVFLPGWAFELSIKTLRWCRANKRPAFVMSESSYEDETRIWWREFIKSWLFVRKFEGALVGADLHADYIAKLGIPRSKIFKGYDAVDNSHFLQLAHESKVQEVKVRTLYPKIPQRPFFMASFRLIPRKNAGLLLAAYKAYRLRLATEAWDLVICGSGEQREELLKTIHLNNLTQNVHIVGFLSYYEIGHWYGLAEAFIHPALKEQWGLVVNEACAAGLPILCSDTVGSSQELVHDGVNGFLFDPTNLDDLTEAMVKIHNVGVETRKNMGRESRRLVAACAPEVFGKNVVNAVLSIS